MVGLIATNTLQNSLTALTHTMNGKRAVTPHDWKKFSSKYTAEMKSTKSLKAIRDLGERSKNGEIIRLLCYEKDNNPYCQRYMLKLFIDEFSLANA
jgi:uncharacterized protein YeaO (DUF488 family)